MASKTDDHVGKPDESNHHTTDTKTNNQSTTFSAPSQQRPPIQWPPHSYPPQVCYPPEILPPNGQFPVYAPRPPDGGFNHYPYAQPSPALYYGPGYVASPHRQGRCSGTCRCILIFLILLIIFLVISKLIIWATLLPRFPVFRVENMSVSNFNPDANPFTAKWDTKLTVGNPNKKLNIYLDKVEGFMNYNDKYDVGFTWINPMFMESKNKTTMRVVITTGESAHHAVPIWIAQEMGKDQKNGAVNFVLKFRVWATLKSSTWLWFRRSLVLEVECDDLKVNFGGSSKDGTLESRNREDCDVKT